MFKKISKEKIQLVSKLIGKSEDQIRFEQCKIAKHIKFYKKQDLEVTMLAATALFELVLEQDIQAADHLITTIRGMLTDKRKEKESKTEKGIPKEVREAIDSLFISLLGEPAEEKGEESFAELLDKMAKRATKNES